MPGVQLQHPLLERSREALSAHAASSAVLGVEGSGSLHERAELLFAGIGGFGHVVEPTTSVEDLTALLDPTDPHRNGAAVRVQETI